jgi:diguanylate cyclase (GGDEF)-like protein
MIPPPIPPDEAERLAVLRELNILDTPPEERFDRITRISQEAFKVPICLISLVDADRQWFKSCQGLAVRETAREISFCGHALLSEDSLYVPDARQDERFHDNPLVTGEPFVRMYAGHPLLLPNGSKAGTLCVIDHKPRILEAGELALLRDLAKLAEHELNTVHLTELVLELKEFQDSLIRTHKQLARNNEILTKSFLIDRLTGLPNRRYFELFLSRALNRTRRGGQSLSLLYFDLDFFRIYNAQEGTRAGDELLQQVGSLLKESVKSPPQFLARLKDDEFAVVLPGADSQDAMAYAHDIRSRIKALKVEHPGSRVGRYVTVTVGGFTTPPDSIVSPEAVMGRVNQALGLGKSRGYNCVNCAV